MAELSTVFDAELLKTVFCAAKFRKNRTKFTKPGIGALEKRACGAWRG